MAGIDDALERLVTDTAFRATLEQDPQAALADYDLTEDERELLTSQLSQGAGASGGVEQRTSKSGLAGALGMFDDAVAAAPRDAGLDSVEMQAHDAGTPQADDPFSFGADPPGTLEDEPDGPMDMGPARAGDHEPAADTIPQEHMTLNFGKVEPTGKANAQDLTLTKYTDPAGDPDQPIIVGSLYNADEPEPSDGTSEVQDGLSNTVMVSETTDEPDSAGSKKGKVEYAWKVEEGVKADGAELGLTGEGTPGGEDADSHGMSSPYLKKAAFDNAMDPSGGTDDLVAGGTDGASSSPTISQPLVNNEVVEYDDSHEIEMDVHVGRSEPDDALTTGEPSTDTDTPPTLGDVVVVKELD